MMTSPLDHVTYIYASVCFLEQVYWADNSAQHIKRCSYDGHGCRVVQTGLQSPSGVSIFEDTLYWCDYQNRSIYKSPKKPGAWTLDV